MLRFMPTQNPRLSITLTPACAAVLKELSVLAGNSQSAIVGELLETSLPVFERVVSALRAASTIQKSAKTEIAAGLDRAQAKLEGQLGLLMDDMDDGLRPLLAEAERVSRRGAGATGSKRSVPVAVARKRLTTPVPLTGGSGHPRSRVKAGRRGRV